MKLRKQSSRRKWRNRFYRIERAAAFQTVTAELLTQAKGEEFARKSVSLALDDWIARNAIGEVGEREIDCSLGALAGPSMWQSNSVMYRATVLAKRPYWIKHKRAGAKV